MADIQPPAAAELAKPLPERQMGFLEDAFEITGDIVNTSDLWPPDTTLESWDRLMSGERTASRIIKLGKVTKQLRAPRKAKT